MNEVVVGLRVSLFRATDALGGHFTQMRRLRATWLIAVALGQSLIAPFAQSADDPRDVIVNPQYTAWEKFKLGSSSTWAMDMDSAAGRVHVEITSVLRGIDDSGVTLVNKLNRTVAGKPQTTPDQQIKYEHWMKRANLAQLPDEDVESQEKIYRCKVYQVSSGVVGGNNRVGSKSTLYLNDSVPGGVVKAEVPSATGKPVVMVLVRSDLNSTGNASLKSVPEIPSTKPALASFDAFRFEVPTGWTRVQPDKKKTVAMILLNGVTWDKSEGMLKVDVGKPTFPTARQMAQAIAGKDGRVLAEAVSLDGTDAIRVETPSFDLSRPRLVVVAFRGEKAYLIMAAGVKGVDVSNAFDGVLKTWRWNGGL